MRLDIQFDNDQPRRNAKMLIEVDQVFSTEARKAGFVEFFFDSKSPKLIKFCKRALGFNEYQGGSLSDSKETMFIPTMIVFHRRECAGLRCLYWQG